MNDDDGIVGHNVTIILIRLLTVPQGQVLSFVS